MTFPMRCKACQRVLPLDGPDPCLGMLPGVSAACCGHGGEAYVLFSNGQVLRGRFDSSEKLDNVGKERVLDGLPRKEWEDIGYWAVAAFGEYVVDFIVGRIGDDEPDIIGHVKWDGCSNWMTESGNYDIHTCGHEGIVGIGTALVRCWEWAAEALPTFDK